ncbi:DUF167 domain-containing protein [Sphaerisporangium sp. NPDC088356]|uniref:DUF167 domain-containing protein n=1 Tax=Sphaerisporangium sp. NPDC088356 TaxID=3154871 RepID=UPI00342F2A95
MAAGARPAAARESAAGAYGGGAIGRTRTPGRRTERPTAAVLSEVGAAFDVRLAEVRLVSGPTSMDKILEIIGNEQELTERAALLLMT